MRSACPRSDALLASGALDQQLQQRNVTSSRSCTTIEARQDVAALGSARRARALGAHPAHRGCAGRARRDDPGQRRAARAAATGEGCAVLPAERCLQARAYGRNTARSRTWISRLHEAQSRWIRVDRARKSVPTNTGDFAARRRGAEDTHRRTAGAAACRGRSSSDYLPQIAVARARGPEGSPGRLRSAGALRARAPCTTAPRTVPTPPRPRAQAARRCRSRGPRRGMSRSRSRAPRCPSAVSRACAARSGAAAPARAPASRWPAAACAPLARSHSPPQTIGDLASQGPVDVQKNTAGRAPTPPRPWRTTGASSNCSNTDPKLRAEAMRRLGDLNQESGQLDGCDRSHRQVDLKGAEAIRLYTLLLKAYPDYARNDQVLYQLARAYEATGQPDQALATLDQLIAPLPATPQIDEVQFRRGELLFSGEGYRRAADGLCGRHRAGRRPQPSTSRALYKHGWSLFKQSMNEESLPSFGGVLDQDCSARQPVRCGTSTALACRPRAGRGHAAGDEHHLLLSGRCAPASMPSLQAAGDRALHLPAVLSGSATCTSTSSATRMPPAPTAPSSARDPLTTFTRRIWPCRPSRPTTRAASAELVLDGKREYVAAL